MKQMSRVLNSPRTHAPTYTGGVVNETLRGRTTGIIVRPTNMCMYGVCSKKYGSVDEYRFYWRTVQSSLFSFSQCYHWSFLHILCEGNFASIFIRGNKFCRFIEHQLTGPRFQKVSSQTLFPHSLVLVTAKSPCIYIYIYIYVYTYTYIHQQHNFSVLYLIRISTG